MNFWTKRRLQNVDVLFGIDEKVYTQDKITGIVHTKIVQHLTKRDAIINFEKDYLRVLIPFDLPVYQLLSNLTSSCCYTKHDGHIKVYNKGRLCENWGLPNLMYLKIIRHWNLLNNMMIYLKSPYLNTVHSTYIH